MHTPDPPRSYRVNVGAILRRVADGRFLLARRIDNDHWQFPQGGVDPGETHEQALYRELGEELGLADARAMCRLIGHGPVTQYDFPLGYEAPVAKRYRGQVQTLYLLDFLGRDEDIRLDAWDEPEFVEFEWLDLEQARARIWHLKRPVFDATLGALLADESS